MNLVITSQPKNLAKGQWVCEFTETGLALTKKKSEPIFIPVSSSENPEMKVVYGGKNSFTVNRENGKLELFVTGFGSYQKRFAHDIAEWLNRRCEIPVEEEYKLEWFFFIPCVLPLGIPIITRGGALPAAIGFGVAGGLLAVVQKEEWSASRRIATCLLIIGITYGLFIYLITKFT